MKKTIKFYLLAILLFTFAVSFAACKNDSKKSNSNPNNFTEAKAITEALKNHPEFPVNSNTTITKDLTIGGPQGSTAKVKFTTNAEACAKDEYLVTLTKDWGFSVNGTYVKSFWKYKVSPHSTSLIESVDHDNLPGIMK